MKIMLVHHCGLLGGGTLSSFDVVNMLTQCGHSVKLALINPSESIIEICKRQSIDYITDTPHIVALTYHNASSSFIHALVKYYMSRKNISKWKYFLNKYRMDYLLLNSSAMAPLLKIAKELNIPCGCFIRETKRLHGNSFLLKLQHNMLSFADKLFFLTEYDKKEWNCVCRDRQYVVPDVLDKNMFKYSALSIKQLRLENGVPEDSFCVLYLGGISRVKGSLDILESMNRIISSNNKNIHLIILGNKAEHFLSCGLMTMIKHFHEIKYVRKCYKLIAELGSNVKNPGLVSNVGEWYQMCDIVVFPVKNVHQARPAYEAGFYSKPIVLPAYPNFNEIVIHNVNGLMYEIGSVDDLADSILALFADRKKCFDIGCQNYRMYELNHSFEVSKKILKTVFEEKFETN